MFDDAGRVQSTTDANNKQTSFFYDEANQLTETRTPEGFPVRTEYWANGAVRAQIDGLGNRTEFEYSTRGELKTQKDPLGRTTTYNSYRNGRVWQRQEHGGNCGTGSSCTTFTYNAAGQPLTIAYSDPDTPDVTGITYDGAGRRTQMTDGSGTSTWSWDSLGNIDAYTNGAGDVIDYQYQAGPGYGRLLYRVDYPGAAGFVTYTYDEMGRSKTLADWNAKTSTFAWDLNSNLDTITYPTGTNEVDNFDYFRDNHMQKAEFKRSGVAYGTETYTRLAAGQVDTVDAAGLAGSVAGVDFDYAYDNNTRLTRTTPAATPTYGYDNADNLTGLLDGSRQVFDAANQLCFAAPSGVTGGSCGSTPAGATDYDYDTRGNRTAKTPPTGPASTYTYDQANRLASATVPKAGNDGEYTALATPARVQDTRTTPGTKITPANPLVTTITGGSSGVPTTGVEAVVLNVTVVDPSAAGHLTAYPAGTTKPAASNINYTTAQTISNLVVTQVNAAGQVEFYVHADTHIVIDVVGWYASPTGSNAGMFNALSPGRLIDTRDPAVPAIGGGAAGTAIQVAGQQGVPATGATAVVVNITATGQNGAGFIKAYPDQDPGTPRPASVNLNYPASGDLSGLSVVKLGADGKIRVYSNVTTDVVIDVFGWYSTPSGSGNAFTPATPIRLLQTTDTAGVCTPDCGRLDNNPTGSNRTLSVKLAGEGTVPATGVTAVSVTLTAVNPSAAGHIRLWASGDTEPAVSNINFQAGQTIANAAIVKLGNDGYLNIRSINADTDVIIDVNGWYTTTATDHWQYHYNGDGTRTQKIGADTTTNYTYTPTGLPTLLKETTGNQTTYYIYGPTAGPPQSRSVGL